MTPTLWLWDPAPAGFDFESAPPPARLDEQAAYPARLDPDSQYPRPGRFGRDDYAYPASVPRRG